VSDREIAEVTGQCKNQAAHATALAAAGPAGDSTGIALPPAGPAALLPPVPAAGAASLDAVARVQRAILASTQPVSLYDLVRLTGLDAAATEQAATEQAATALAAAGHAVHRADGTFTPPPATAAPGSTP